MEVKGCGVQLQGIIYIDSIFALNLVMDLYLLLLTAKALGKTVSYLRIFAGSITGAAGYCLILCVPGISYILKVLLGMIPTGGLMIKIACRTKGIKELLRAMGYLFTFSFIMGGFIIFLKGKSRLFAGRESLPHTSAPSEPAFQRNARCAASKPATMHRPKLRRWRPDSLEHVGESNGFWLQPAHQLRGDRFLVDR